MGYPHLWNTHLDIQMGKLTALSEKPDLNVDHFPQGKVWILTDNAGRHGRTSGGLTEKSGENQL